MIPEACEHARGLVALEVVGQLGEEERVALLAHTDGCPACRQERADLLSLVTVLPAADPGHLSEPELPFALRGAVLGRLRADARRHRRRRRAGVALGAVAAGAVAAVVLVLTLAGPTSPAATTVALGGSPGVHATMRLTAEPWGTAMELRESGQPPGEVLSVATRTVGGAWWPTGTYRTVGTSVRVTMACALKLDDIAGVWIRDRAGTVVLHGTLRGYAEGNGT
ncbi:MAG TPA: zf-HC2 domain-containing protein [Acidimicrobiales bacterium]|nr:zf-HC2 domain-containing protein [Acidimicrobiales bacterium]